MVFPVPKPAAGGVAVRLPVVPLMPETSMRMSRAVSVTPLAAPTNTPLDDVSRPATWICTDPSASMRAPELKVSEDIS